MTREEAEASEGLVLDLLRDIVVEARGAVNFDSIAHLAIGCAAHTYRRLISDDTGHVKLVEQAHQFATQGKWALAAHFLKH